MEGRRLSKAKLNLSIDNLLTLLSAGNNISPRTEVSNKSLALKCGSEEVSLDNRRVAPGNIASLSVPSRTGSCHIDLKNGVARETLWLWSQGQNGTRSQRKKRNLVINCSSTGEQLPMGGASCHVESSRIDLFEVELDSSDFWNDNGRGQSTEG